MTIPVILNTIDHSLIVIDGILAKQNFSRSTHHEHEVQTEERVSHAISTSG